MKSWRVFAFLIVLALPSKVPCFLLTNITNSPSINSGGSSTLVFLMQQMKDLRSKFEKQEKDIRSLKTDNIAIKSLQSELSLLKMQGQDILREYHKITNNTRLEDIDLQLKNLETSIRYFSLSLAKNNKTLLNQIESVQTLENSKIQNIEYEIYSLRTMKTVMENLTARVHDLEYDHVIPGRIRLVNGSTAWMGRVEVSQNGSWATLSDAVYFDDNDAKVVCRMLGLPWQWAVAKKYAYFGRGSGAIAYDLKGLQCKGDEPSIYDCTRHKASVGGRTYQEKNLSSSIRQWSNMYCRKAFDNEQQTHTLMIKTAPSVHMSRITSFLSRTAKSQITVSIRLAGGLSPSNGRVEVNLGGMWGTICDDSWDDNEATVVCRMLGYSGTAKAFQGTMNTTGSGVIWMEELGCTGSESSIMNCKLGNNYRFQVGYAGCYHYEDASVNCS